MSTTFGVDDVAPEPERLQHDPALIEAMLGSKPDLVDAQGVPVPAENTHPLVAATGLAYRSHRPLVLSPDAVWLTIAQGFALHVLQHAVDLRERLVAHDGRRKLVVECEAVSDVADWRQAISGFAAGIADAIGPGLAHALECDFTTTGELERTVSRAVMMNTFRAYFDYEPLCICGIPTVTLTGTSADWRSIRERFDVIAEYNLGWWHRRLVPVLDQLVASAEGRADRNFWQCIWQPQEIYCGDDDVQGWVQRFFPYSGETGDRRNEMREWTLPRRAHRKPVEPPPERRQWLCAGVKSSDFPRGLARVPVRLRDPNGNATPLAILCGFLGVTQDDRGAVHPNIGWAMTTRSIQDVLDDLAPMVRRIVPEAEDSNPVRRVSADSSETPAHLIAFWERFGPAAAIGGLLVHTKHLASTKHGMAFASLDSGMLALQPSERKRRLRSGRTRSVRARRVLWCPKAGQPQVVADSLLEFFERLTEGQPPWFLRPGYEPLASSP